MTPVAHEPLAPGGPGVLFLVLAAFLFAMAVYLLVTKGPPRTILLLVLLAVAIAIGSVAAPDGAPYVHLSIEAPLDGASVPAEEEIEVRVAISDAPESSHLHVLVDGVVVSMTAGAKTGVMLDPGRHTIEAELVSASHRPLSPRVVARAEVTALGT